MFVAPLDLARYLSPRLPQGWSRCPRVLVHSHYRRFFRVIRLLCFGYQSIFTRRLVSPKGSRHARPIRVSGRSSTASKSPCSFLPRNVLQLLLP